MGTSRRQAERPPRGGQPATGLARALSKLGFCSRSQAGSWIGGGRVKVNGVVRQDPLWPVRMRVDRIEVDDRQLKPPGYVYLVLNKPRGLVTTTQDEKGRATVFECLREADLPRVMPVGRLDQASEGLLLFTNDTAWADGITSPDSHWDKTYHVQIDRLADESLLQGLRAGLTVAGDFLQVKQASIVRQGERNCWLEMVIDEGKNRHLRRLLAGFGISVLRLIRIAVGPLQLGPLAKGAFRHLATEEVEALRRAPGRSRLGPG